VCQAQRSAVFAVDDTQQLLLVEVPVCEVEYRAGGLFSVSVPPKVGRETPTEFHPGPAFGKPKPDDSQPGGIAAASGGPITKPSHLGVTEDLAKKSETFGARQRPIRRQIPRDLGRGVQFCKGFEVHRREGIQLEACGGQSHDNLLRRTKVEVAEPWELRVCWRGSHTSRHVVHRGGRIPLVRFTKSLALLRWGSRAPACSQAS
jgi:hypothetical protein